MKTSHEALFTFGQTERGAQNYNRFKDLVRQHTNTGEETVGFLGDLYGMPDSIAEDDESVRETWRGNYWGFSETTVFGCIDYSNINQYKLVYNADGDSMKLLEWLASNFQCQIDVESASLFDDRYYFTVLTGQQCFQSMENREQTFASQTLWRNRCWRRERRSSEDAIRANRESVFKLMTKYEEMNGEDNDSDN